MIRQSFANTDDILEKKFKILRTSIMLGNLRNREEMMNEYEETAKQLDTIKKDEYEELLASKMYTTTSLEDEQDRLKNLIGFIENRIQERNDFIDDYIKVTSNFLDDLPRVSLENDLPVYKERLKNIDDYLNNCQKIKELNEKIKSLRDDLQIKYENKANSEVINSKLEDELIDEFNHIIANDKYYSELNYTDIDSELLKLDDIIADKQDVMNTFISSYEALNGAGISGAEREEYKSYVQDARDDYYNELEKKYMLNIYKLVLDKESDYDKLYAKRENIDHILKERGNNRIDLEITDSDPLEYFINLCEEQFSIIKSQKLNMESIDKLILEIADCESQLEKIQHDNDRTEISDLLNEYVVEKPEIEKVELPVEEEIHEEVIKKNLDDITLGKAANMVVRVDEPIKMNVKMASDTAKLVMKKVVIVLEPKKFNGKRNKLREAEKELEERKRQEKILKEIKEKEEEEKKNISSDDSLFVENKDAVGIKLDTNEIFDNDDDTEEKLNTVKIVLPENKEDISIPTEIFVEEPETEEKIDLFKETDPFLDDNQFEISKSEGNAETSSSMPTLKNIGTVKPNNMLSKIEDVVEDSNKNDDIVLPSMGLADISKSDIPIVSENYIN